MTALNEEHVQGVVRALMDAMRNTSMQLVQGDVPRALEYIAEADAAHAQLGALLRGNQQNEAAAGRAMYLVLGQRAAALRALIVATTEEPKPPSELAAIIARPLDPV